MIAYVLFYFYWYRVAWREPNNPRLNNLIAPEKAALIAGVGALVADIIRLFIYTFVTFFNGDVTFFGKGGDHAWSQLTGTMVVDVVIFASLFVPCCCLGRRAFSGTLKLSNLGPVKIMDGVMASGAPNGGNLPALLWVNYAQVRVKDDH